MGPDATAALHDNCSNNRAAISRMHFTSEVVLEKVGQESIERAATRSISLDKGKGAPSVLGQSPTAAS